MTKEFQFWHHGKFYRFSCGIPDSEKPGPNGEPAVAPLPDSKTVRGFYNISGGVIYRD